MSYATWSIQWGEGWGPIRFDQSREEVIEVLRRENVEFDGDDEDSVWLDLCDFEIEMTFDDAPPHRLAQLLVNEPEVAIRGDTLMGSSLPAALELLGIRSQAQSLWRRDAESTYSLDDAPPPVDRDSFEAPSTTVEPEELLTRGTLWVRELGLGLVMRDGVVGEFVLRAPDRVPKHGDGPLTPEQRQLAAQDDLPALLARRARRERGSWLVRLGTLWMIASIAAIVWLAVNDQTRWHAVLPVEGTIVSIENHDATDGRDVYVVEYLDDSGAKHAARWTLADLYVPVEVGEKVQVYYLPEAPDRPLGPAQLRNVGMFAYMPYILGIMGVYVVILSLDGWLRGRKRT